MNCHHVSLQSHPTGTNVLCEHPGNEPGVCPYVHNGQYQDCPLRNNDDAEFNRRFPVRYR
jgi:hypothetical protein